MLATVLLLILVTAAAATDLAQHKIYNAITYPGVGLALALQAAGAALAWKGVSMTRLTHWGWIGLGPSILGFLACGLVMLAAYVFFQVGGGDVKLMAMIGSWMGPQVGIEILLWTFVLGACGALIVLVWRFGPWRLIARAARQILWSVRIAGWAALTPEERARLQPPLFLAPAALVAVVVVQFQLFG